jgi:hypothetical protein
MATSGWPWRREPREAWPAARLLCVITNQTEPDEVSGERRYHGFSNPTLLMTFARTSVRPMPAEYVWLAPITLR